MGFLHFPDARFDRLFLRHRLPFPPPSSNFFCAIVNTLQPAMRFVGAIVATTGRAEFDAIFQSRLRQCRELLAQHPEAK